MPARLLGNRRSRLHALRQLDDLFPGVVAGVGAKLLQCLLKLLRSLLLLLRG